MEKIEYLMNKIEDLGHGKIAVHVKKELLDELEQLRPLLINPAMVPEVVADFIEGAKGRGFCLTDSIVVMKSESRNVLEWYNLNVKKYESAYVNGCTVEKEPLYYIRLKNTNPTNSNHCYLWLNQSTKEVFFETKTLKWTNNGNVKNTFTEKEIDEISDGAFANNKAFETVPAEVEKI
ncbi:DUF1642 domain-containing protein [Enterococcus wangshanyuanii]|uniref:Phage protein n=1 Tax=Enterococcus wangshanyuanii TaxID=2005703 RepID=A0ABQ1NSM9_9ENTE|nr:DUF1642 domain-containing protein [Enterococcus wangshanyuanii]GGC84450.1 hypothetical protein GCM10011573_12610 [Enterococcus wangshanyuanii]